MVLSGFSKNHHKPTHVYDPENCENALQAMKMHPGDVLNLVNSYRFHPFLMCLAQKKFDGQLEDRELIIF